MTRRDALLLAGLGMLFFVDRLTKALVSGTDEQTLQQFHSLRPTLNSGIAFSLPFPSVVATTLIAIIVAMILFFAVRRFQQHRAWFAWALVAIGGLSNLLDRFRFGAVFDFIHLGPLPIFNLADLLVVAGLLLLLLRRDLTAKPKLT